MEMPQLSISRRKVLGGFVVVTAASFLDEILRRRPSKTLDPISPDPDANLHRWEPVKLNDSLTVQVIGCKHEPKTFLDGADTIDALVSGSDAILLEGPATEYKDAADYAAIAKPREGVVNRMRTKIMQPSQNSNTAFFSAVAGLAMSHDKPAYVAEVENSSLTALLALLATSYTVVRSVVSKKIHIAESPIFLEGFSQLKRLFDLTLKVRGGKNKAYTTSQLIEFAYDTVDRRDAYFAWTLHLLSDQLHAQNRKLNVALFRGGLHAKGLSHYLKPENREECRLKALSYPQLDLVEGTQRGEPIQLLRMTDSGGFLPESPENFGK